MGESVNVTFESLYELARREKDSDDLQELPVTFLDDVVRYVRERKAMLDEAGVKTDVFSLAERNKLTLQLQNVRKIVRELWDRREKKILEMVFTCVRTQSNIVDTSKLMPHEQALFDLLVKQLEDGRNKTLYPLLEARLVVAVEDSPTEDPTEAQSAEENAGGVVKVKFTTAVEPFVGKELEEYGPFSENDCVELPRDIADVLVENGQAVIED